MSFWGFCAVLGGCQNQEYTGQSLITWPCLCLCVCPCLCSGHVFLCAFNFRSFISEPRCILIRKPLAWQHIREGRTGGILYPEKIDLRLWQFCFQGRRKIRWLEGNAFPPVPPTILSCLQIIFLECIWLITGLTIALILKNAESKVKFHA